MDGVFLACCSTEKKNSLLTDCCFYSGVAGLRLLAPAIIRTSHKIKAPCIDRMEMVEIGGIFMRKQANKW
ncbi:hypothetical protein ADH70_007880 [Blautia pseudococcoides]|uniref:Uncharacterized protein n=1 Tax=Blautia pseudococcoides TaxID=1796616 RepID=A0A1C7IAX5_9FIRM|nr:hypothetical protein A4V09_09445 [Blautia pseudococcoides]ASU28774.1 hypothetical protein ADH70_007880 [Blautia pseudococcoides]